MTELVVQFLLCLCALACFVVAGFGVPTNRVRAEWLGVGFLVLALLLVPQFVQVAHL